jgi:adenosylcobinamide kinase/adenosylcobinamide-phosphate guanylyltransferase
MFAVYIGYPDSGKSAMAESRASELSGGEGLVYLATMIPYGEEGQQRIARHRAMREGRGFVTIEAPFDICDALSRAFDADELKDRTVLLECVSNLAANELFERHSGEEDAAAKITEEIRKLAASVRHLVAVSNHYGIEDSFDEETRLYSKTLDTINERIAAFADETVSLV